MRTSYFSRHFRFRYSCHERGLFSIIAPDKGLSPSKVLGLISLARRQFITLVKANEHSSLNITAIDRNINRPLPLQLYIRVSATLLQSIVHHQVNIFAYTL